LKPLRFVVAMAARESRASGPRLFLLMATVAVGVAATVAINSFTDSLQGSVRAFLGLFRWLTVALEAAAEHLLAATRPLPAQAVPATTTWRAA